MGLTKGFPPVPTGHVGGRACHRPRHWPYPDRTSREAAPRTTDHRLRAVRLIRPSGQLADPEGIPAFIEARTMLTLATWLNACGIAGAAMGHGDLFVDARAGRPRGSAQHSLLGDVARRHRPCSPRGPIPIRGVHDRHLRCAGLLVLSAVVCPALRSRPRWISSRRVALPQHLGTWAHTLTAMPPLTSSPAVCRQSVPARRPSASSFGPACLCAWGRRRGWPTRPGRRPGRTAPPSRSSDTRAA